MSPPKLITLLFWIRVCGWQHLLETQLCFLIKELSLVDEKKSLIQRELQCCENNQIIFLHKYSPWEKGDFSGNRASQLSVSWIYCIFYLFFPIHWVFPVTLFTAEDALNQCFFFPQLFLLHCFIQQNRTVSKQSSFKSDLSLLSCLQLPIAPKYLKLLNSNPWRFLLKRKKKSNPRRKKRQACLWKRQRMVHWPSQQRNVTTQGRESPTWHLPKPSSVGA